MEKKPKMSVDELTIHVLKKTKKPLSTYELAKQVGISWSTANTHCYKLKAEGKIKGKLEEAKIGNSKKMLWWIGKD